MTLYVYRLFDADDRCLYVGASADVSMRLRRHSKRPWGSQIARAEVTVHGKKLDAMTVERAEIERLAPVHNLMGIAGRCVETRGTRPEIVLSALADGGPMTQCECEKYLNERGVDNVYAFVGGTLCRLLERGEVVVVDERPANKGPRKTARVYGVAA